MTDRPFIVITDADAIIATINKSDANHSLAMQISQQLIEIDAKVITPITAVMEAITALKRVVNRSDLAELLVNRCLDGSIPAVGVQPKMLKLAIPFFDPHSSKQHTFFDAVIAAFAKKCNATAIYSFDQGYKKKGFSLAYDVLFDISSIK